MSATQRVTSDKKDIPTHYVQLSSYGCNARNKPATPEYQSLHGAWTARKLGGWKLMSTPTDQRGPIYVDPEEAEQVLATLRKENVTPHTRSDDAQQHKSACESLADIASSLAGVERLLERLAAAVESIATQPQANQQDLLHTFNGNGFHS